MQYKQYDLLEYYYLILLQLYKSYQKHEHG